MSVLLEPNLTAPPAAVIPFDRTERFLARVDAELKTLPHHEKVRFLDEQIADWRRRYARFICTEGHSEPTVVPDDPPHSSDFLLTITGLSARRSLLEEPKS